MFIKILIGYILGYVKVTVEGYYIERFINICTAKKLLIWNIKRKKGVLLCLNIGKKDFKELIKISKKTNCRIKIKSKKGIPFLFFKYRKRKIFLLLCVVVISTIYISSIYVWNIEIIEENNNVLENIEQDLQEAGLNVGTLKSKINTKSIINNVILKRDDIAWMGIELKGTNAIVKIVKADEAPEIINKDEYCNIVADKSGIITKIIAQNGTAMVNVGDEVQEGAILIAGIMEGQYTDPRYVHATGEVEAKVLYTQTSQIYYNQIVYEESGKTENNYIIKFNDFEINLLKRVSKFEFYDTIETEKKLRIFSNLYLPISIVKITNKELNQVEKNYSLEEATNIGIQELEEELESKIVNKENILR